MNLIGNKVILRAIERKDLEFLREMVNDGSFEEKVVGWSFPVSTEQQIKWYENSDTSNGCKFAIEYIETGEFVGLATLTNIEWKNRSAFHGIKLCNNAQGKGIGTDTVMTIMEYAFNELQLNRLDGSILASNIPSQKLYKKCGWSVEGTVREAVFKKGKYIDLHLVGILAKEYKMLKELQ